MSSRTFYDVLEVTPTASPEVIKGAYRYLVQKWHPDKNPDRLDEAKNKTNSINKAYSVLSDPALRREHDYWIASQNKPPSPQARPTPPTTPPSPPISSYSDSKLEASSSNNWMEKASYYHRLAIHIFALQIFFLFIAPKVFVSYWFALYLIFAFICFRLAKTVNLNPWLYGLAALIPVISLYCIALIVKTTKKFQQNGLKVGFLGGAALQNKIHKKNENNWVWTFTIFGIILIIGSNLQESKVSAEQASLPIVANATSKVIAPNDQTGYAARAQAESQPQNDSYNVLLARYEAQYPKINADSPLYDVELANQVAARMNQFQAAGSSLEESLTLAVSDIIEFHDKDKQKQCTNTGSELSINFKDMELISTLRLISDFSGKKMLISPLITGIGTFRYVCTPWDEVLVDIASKYQLDLKVENGIITVDRQSNQTAQTERRWDGGRASCNSPEYLVNLKNSGLKLHPIADGICVPFDFKSGGELVSYQNCPPCR